MTDAYRQFALLCEKRDLAADRAVAALQVVIDFLEAQDYDGMYVDLRRVLDDFKTIDRRITEFRKQFANSQTETQPAIPTMPISNETFNHAAYDPEKVPLMRPLSKPVPAR